MIRAARVEDVAFVPAIERAAGYVDHPVAYLLLDVVDNGAHIEQVSVHPDHAGRGA